jgi:AbrB family looped-hinge helix DNA binding protein
MVKVDSKGRIVVPQNIREQLGLTPGTKVDVHEEDGRIVVESQPGPEQIVHDLEALIEEAAASRDQPPYDELDSEAKEHLELIRRQAEAADPERRNAL